MDKYVFDNSNRLWYKLIGDYKWKPQSLPCRDRRAGKEYVLSAGKE